VCLGSKKRERESTNKVAYLKSVFIGFPEWLDVAVVDQTEISVFPSNLLTTGVNFTNSLQAAIFVRKCFA